MLVSEFYNSAPQHASERAAACFALLDELGIPYQRVEHDRAETMELCAKIPGAIYCSTLDKVTAALAETAKPGDLILTVGAGDIYKAGEKLVKEGA